MGYLTTFSIYNDGAQNINPSKPENQENIRQLAEALYRASLNTSAAGGDSYSVGNHSNFLRAQRPRHADDPAIYVQLANTVTEMNAHSSETKALMERNPSFAKKLMKVLENQLEDLKILMKNIESR